MKSFLDRVARQARLGHMSLERQLSDGPVSERWLVETESGSLVLTRDRQLARTLLLDRRFQFELLRRVAAQGLGPAPMFCDAEAGVLLVHYLAGKTLRPEELRTPGKLAAAAQLLARVHALPLTALPGTSSLAEKLGAYADFAATPAAADACAEARELLQHWLTRGGRRVICHNDVNHGNLISGIGLRLIDWDYASIGEPYFDLAALIVQAGLDEESARSLLRAYAGAADVTSGERLQGWLRIYELTSRLWEMCIAASR